VGREIVAEILGGLGADVVRLGRSTEFVAIDTEALSDERLRTLQDLANEARRDGPVDAVVSTDGDSDRPLVAGVDSRGSVRFFGGDVLGIVVAEYLGADSVAVPVSATDAVELRFAGRGVAVARTRIGSPYVIAAMAKSAGERKVAWEANGGFLTGSDIEKAGRVLTALPTRDAVLPIVAALHAAFGRGLSLVDLFGSLPRRFGRAGLIDAFPVEASRAILRRHSPDDPRVARAEFEGGRAALRDASGHAVDAPGEERTALAIRERLATRFSPTLGFGEIVGIDWTDGVRASFSNGDIAHLRPSGNAPQLRIYAVAGDPARADAIVREALREPDGILRAMEQEAGA
jgi:phosphomannomutase